MLPSWEEAGGQVSLHRSQLLVEQPQFSFSGDGEVSHGDGRRQGQRTLLAATLAAGAGDDGSPHSVSVGSVGSTSAMGPMFPMERQQQQQQQQTQSQQRHNEGETFRQEADGAGEQEQGGSGTANRDCRRSGAGRAGRVGPSGHKKRRNTDSAAADTSADPDDATPASSPPPQHQHQHQHQLLQEQQQQQQHRQEVYRRAFDDQLLRFCEGIVSVTLSACDSASRFNSDLEDQTWLDSDHSLARFEDCMASALQAVRSLPRPAGAVQSHDPSIGEPRWEQRHAWDVLTRMHTGTTEFVDLMTKAVTKLAQNRVLMQKKYRQQLDRLREVSSESALRVVGEERKQAAELMSQQRERLREEVRRFQDDAARKEARSREESAALQAEITRLREQLEQQKEQSARDAQQHKENLEYTVLRETRDLEEKYRAEKAAYEHKYDLLLARAREELADVEKQQQRTLQALREEHQAELTSWQERCEQGCEQIKSVQEEARAKFQAMQTQHDASIKVLQQEVESQAMEHARQVAELKEKLVVQEHEAHILLRRSAEEKRRNLDEAEAAHGTEMRKFMADLKRAHARELQHVKDRLAREREYEVHKLSSKMAAMRTAYERKLRGDIDVSTSLTQSTAQYDSDDDVLEAVRTSGDRVNISQTSLALGVVRGHRAAGVGGIGEHNGDGDDDDDDDESSLEPDTADSLGVNAGRTETKVGEGASSRRGTGASGSSAGRQPARGKANSTRLAIEEDPHEDEDRTIAAAASATEHRSVVVLYPDPEDEDVGEDEGDAGPAATRSNAGTGSGSSSRPLPWAARKRGGESSSTVKAAHGSNSSRTSVASSAASSLSRRSTRPLRHPHRGGTGSRIGGDQEVLAASRRQTREVREKRRRGGSGGERTRSKASGSSTSYVEELDKYLER